MPHYYSKHQDSKIVLKPIKLNIRNVHLNIYTSSGVFAKRAIDKGTSLLIESMIINKGWEALDIGCGYGAVGLAASKISGMPSYLIDINKRATGIAEINAKLNNIKVVVLNGNLYEPLSDKKFDTILINPPQTAGKEICFAMITGSKYHFKEDGLLQLVARPNKGGRTLANKMKEVFGNVYILAKKSGFAVYISKNGT